MIWYKRILSTLLSNSSSYQKFAILCSARSGSTWLHTLLNSHPSIHSNGEIVRTNHLSKRPLPFHEFAFKGYPKLIKAVGLKIFYENPIYAESFEAVMEDQEVKIIFLTRRSALAQFVSLKLAEATKEWVNTSTEKKQINLNIEEYKQFELQERTIRKEILRRLAGSNFLDVYYEDLVTNPSQELGRIQTFLGVRKRKLLSLLRKQGDDDFSKQIANWNEIKYQLEDSYSASF